MMKHIGHIASLCAALLVAVTTWGQEEATSTMPSDRNLILHSYHVLDQGTLKASVSSAVGTDSREDDLFGLEDGDLRVAVDFAPLNRLQFGVGNTFGTEVIDGYLKYALLDDTGFPVTLVSAMYLNTEPWLELDRENYFTSRLAYNLQAIVGHKFPLGANRDLDVSLAPGLLHRNLVSLNSESHDVIHCGLMANTLLGERLRVSAEYIYVLSDQLLNRNTSPILLGLSYMHGNSTLGLTLGNSAGLNEWTYIADTSADLGEGELRVGIHLTHRFGGGVSRPEE